MKHKGIHALEGLGYVAAVLVGLAGIGGTDALRLFHVGGLMLALIVIVRLLAFIASLSAEEDEGAAPAKAAPAASPAQGQKEEVTQ